MGIQEKAKKIRLLITDVDGVMTDGKLYYSNNGDQLKSFDVTDGLGFILIQKQGIKCAIITAKSSKIVSSRAKDLGIEKVYQGYNNKIDALNDVKKSLGVAKENICYIGDDIIDLPVLERVGFAVAVNNAQSEVKEKADYITKKCGGQGAIREVCELILNAKGKWKEVLNVYSKNNK